MTVAELIAALQRMPPDLPVLVDADDSGGWLDVEDVDENPGSLGGGSPHCVVLSCEV